MAQTINLGTKYLKQIMQQYTIASILKGRLSSEIDMVGTKSVRIHTINSVPMNDYKREGTERYGAPVEVGDTLQELTMTQDKSFAGTIDKGNSLDQSINKAGKFLRVQMSEVVVPVQDRYGFGELGHKAGKIVGSTAAISAGNVLDRLSAARAWMLNHRVPLAGRTLYVSTLMYNALVQSEHFKNLDRLGGKALVTGQVGEIIGVPVVEAPDDLMPAGVNFIMIHRAAAVNPAKIADTKVHVDPPGISGNLVEGRFYYDTFVYGAKSAGIYVDVTTGGGVSVLSAPTLAAATGAITGVTTGAQAIYTTDGSDPRYSTTAQVYTAAPSLADGTLLRAYLRNANEAKVYASEVAAATIGAA